MSFYPNETDLAKGGLVSRSTLLPKKEKSNVFITNYMENGDNASRAVISYIDYVNRTSSGVFQKLNVMIDADQTVSMRYHSPSNTVYFKSLEDYSDRTLYEEIIHALQRVVYSDYWEVPFNIEFEAKLIMDYMMSLRSQPKLLPSIINEINSHR